MEPLITKADIERRIGVRSVAELSADDGGLDADNAVVTDVIQEASDRAAGLLWHGFPSEEQIAELVQADTSVRGAIVDIACELLGKRRALLQDAEGKTPYSGWAAKAEEVLTDIASGKRRAVGEGQAGRNHRIGSRVNRRRGDGLPVFAGTKNNPRGPGGF